MIYFAYGSNMLYRRIRDRVSSPVALGQAKLTRYKLIFYKRGMDGSGKCGVLRTGLPSDSAFGVLYRFDSQEKQRLDRVEGVGEGYLVGSVGVSFEGQTVTASIYFPDEAFLDENLRPFKWYKRLVLEGARENLLPEGYVQKSIQGVEAVDDPDLERIRSNLRLLDDRMV